MTTNTSPHTAYIKKCLALAEKSPPRPTNFRVGALLLSRKDNDPTFTDDRILSTGYTMELAGNTHAEQCCFSNYAAVHNVPDDQVSTVLPAEPGRKLIMMLTEAGIEWEHVSGLEREILTVATAGHENGEEEVRAALGEKGTDIDDISPEERRRQEEAPRNPKKRMMEGEISLY
ncbi:hypothetical protein PENARI_c013G08598 [Penicillium arizonense]|uniref:CMP/dCMP-type deaminase domain-containing protein n=1 Tax=Penicillium arizonense TaxID=1835702 RepID=A0A1F5LEB5_PENAI|nr:hypothetical protein PENARI_c013G08598 [Penicillium arizonense]OGE51553.1 hypothetical protein PENARI_c013G08598 [Penicillium arizonense]